MPRRIGRPTSPPANRSEAEPIVLAPFNFVRAWRRGRGWTLEDLAEAVGTTKASISRIENRLQGITPQTGPLLAQVFGTSLAVLYSRGPTPEELGRDAEPAGTSADSQKNPKPIQ